MSPEGRQRVRVARAKVFVARRAKTYRAVRARAERNFARAGRIFLRAAQKVYMFNEQSRIYFIHFSHS